MPAANMLMHLYQLSFLFFTQWDIHGLSDSTWELRDLRESERERRGEEE